MKLSKMLGAALIATAVHGGIQAAPVSFNGHEYDVIRAEDITWSDANAAAVALGGGWHLATIISAAENTFVASLLPLSVPDRSHFWLGGTDAAVEGVWTWVTGEAFGYSNWAGGEPNNSGNEDYLAMDLRGAAYAWNDAPGNMLAAGYDMARGYIIEQDAFRTGAGDLGAAGLGRAGGGILASTPRSDLTPFYARNLGLQLRAHFIFAALRRMRRRLVCGVAFAELNPVDVPYTPSQAVGDANSRSAGLRR